MTGLPPSIRSLARIGAICLSGFICATLPAVALAQTSITTRLDTTVVDARDAARRRDRNRLAGARAALQAGNTRCCCGWTTGI